MRINFAHKYLDFRVNFGKLYQFFRFLSARFWKFDNHFVENNPGMRIMDGEINFRQLFLIGILFSDGDFRWQTRFQAMISGDKLKSSVRILAMESILDGGTCEF